MKDKKALRAVFRKIRSQIQHREVKDHAIEARILELQKIYEADVVLVYASYNSEVSTYGIISKLLNMGKILALPRCEKNGIMNFHTINSLDELTTGSYNIPEPSGITPITCFTDKTVCIVPGLAFTEKGERLGYGGGFYDRFLALFPEIYTIALAYEEVITDELPVMPYDFKVNTIATEERLVYCSAK